MVTVKEAGLAKVDMKLEVVVIPVSDAARAEQFYRSLGWRQDVTPPGSGAFQFTPHGSACSVQFGKELTTDAPGSAQKTYLIVSDIEAARNALVAAGIDVSEIFHLTPSGPVAGVDPNTALIARAQCPAIPTEIVGCSRKLRRDYLVASTLA